MLMENLQVMRENRYKIPYFYSIYISFFGLRSLIGRTLLGVSGLIQAYKEAGANTLKNAEIVIIEPEINQQINLLMNN